MTVPAPRACIFCPLSSQIAPEVAPLLHDSPPRIAARPADAAPPACPSAAVLKKTDPRPEFRGNFCEAVRRSAPRLLEGFAPALPPGVGLSRRPSVRGFAPPFPKNPPYIEKPARTVPRGRCRLRLCRGACCRGLLSHSGKGLPLGLPVSEILLSPFESAKISMKGGHRSTKRHRLEICPAPDRPRLGVICC